MPDKNYTATVAKDLEDLIPVFIQNRTKELESLREAMGAGDFEELKRLGHRMRGVGFSYGFEPISDFGKTIEEAAKSSTAAVIETCIVDYADYLANVKIVYA